MPATKRASSPHASTSSAPARKKAKAAEEESRWPWIDRCRPEMEFKGTKIVAYNCGGQYFEARGKTVAARLDKLEAFLAECEGDETAHPSYGAF